MTALLEVDDLVVDFPLPGGRARVLHHVDLRIGAGEAVGLVGESGCGKSMTALAVMGLMPPAAETSGSIRLAGEDLLGRSDAAMSRVRGRRIGMIFQEPMTALNPVRTIGDQVAEGMRLHFGLGRREALDRAVSLLERVGLPPDRFPPGLYPHQLSGGQRQRVVIAIALACGPELLIADEPTTALDVTIQAQILDLITEVAAETGSALMMISHDLGVIAETTDRMLVMYAGTVVEEGPTAEVFAHMAHPYTRGLFAAMPSRALVGAGRGRLATIPGQVPDPRRPRVGCPFAPRCPRAREQCRTEIPPADPFGPDHRVRCFYPGPEASGG
ncbi:peptide/nickel transport system ATP-binding protein [Tepidamorphus gemmatus]|uniref:Peptide/nickel transport system ATP-binding protein n=1 Tax=Tepidamorphus gemmatus TaxID=747076 RepID=A0A4R3LXR1_9HYPH|nr:ABC transporter ATP-binding protein [Tepidamorphus gemmatus]TCT05441.1 peptide/nickel transport system ATP-binding protein [Tepidamorphus gemmatus]